MVRFGPDGLEPVRHAMLHERTPKFKVGSSWTLSLVQNLCLAVGRGSSPANITMVHELTRDIHSRHHAWSPHISPFSFNS